MAAEQGTFSTSDGCTIAYSRHHSAPNGAPRLALIHSLALDRSIWDGVVARLSDRAEILTYDCRGHGRSDRPHMDYTAELFARDLAELLDHLNWDQATVAGCSMGGCVAQAFGGLYASRSRALALIDTSGWYGPNGPKQFRERAAAAKQKGMKALTDFQVSRWFSEKFTQANSEVVNRCISIFAANDLDCYAASCVLLGDADLRKYLPAFRMPVTVIVGEEDYAAPVAMAKALHDTIPRSTLKIIQGRHLTPIECPDEIAAEIEALLERA
jgi:3-oxoadipate enol-lactonase